MSKTNLVYASLCNGVALGLCASVFVSGCESEPEHGATRDQDGGVSATDWCDVKPIFDGHCTECHDGEGSAGAPMALTTYAALQAAAPVSTGKKVFQAVGVRIHDSEKPMPPTADLSAEQLETLDAWIAGGAKAGVDPTCSASAQGAAATELEGVWPPPEGCDAIYKITAHGSSADAPYMVQPGAEFHPQITVDAPWGDELVQAIAFHPITDNKQVLHHWILYANQGVAAFLTGWAPGDDARSPMPSDVGMDMPTGPAAMRLDMHYNTLTATGPELDQSGVEICVVKGANLRKNHAAITMSLTSLGFPLAPANSTGHESTGVCNVTASEPVHLMTAGPHSHTYAVGHRFTVKKKSGEEIVMLDHAFQFGEQKSYRLEPEVILETGDTVYTTCVYTNTTNRNINFGQNTGDEMCFNFASYYPKGALNCGGGLLGGLGGLLGGLGGGAGGSVGE
jgi:hypothetical protein